MVYDSARAVTVLVGLGDTWEWNGTNWRLRAPPQSPSSRESPWMVYDSDRGETVLFGGYTGTYWLGDTWIWTGSAN
jgi:hypothetical protein